MSRHRQTEKRCPDCETIKAASEFFKNCVNGLSSYCKTCSAARKRKGSKTMAQLMSERYPIAGHKLCSTCQTIMPLSYFNSKSDGRPKPRCKHCQSVQFRDWLSRTKYGGKDVPTRAQNWAARSALIYPTRITKVCTKCRIEKPRREFRNIGGGKIAFRCNDCRNIESNAAYGLNKEQMRIKRAAYRAANRERVRLYARNGFKRRRAARKGALATLTTAEWELVLDFYGRKCLKCGSTEDLSMDHVIPLVKGGAHTADNVQPLCCSCNSSKHTKTIDYRPVPFSKSRAA